MFKQLNYHKSHSIVVYVGWLQIATAKSEIQPTRIFPGPTTKKAHTPRAIGPVINYRAILNPGRNSYIKKHDSANFNWINLRTTNYERLLVSFKSHLEIYWRKLKGTTAIHNGMWFCFSITRVFFFFFLFLLYDVIQRVRRNQGLESILLVRWFALSWSNYH